MLFESWNILVCFGDSYLKYLELNRVKSFYKIEIYFCSLEIAKKKKKKIYGKTLIT